MERESDSRCLRRFGSAGTLDFSAPQPPGGLVGPDHLMQRFGEFGEDVTGFRWSRLPRPGGRDVVTPAGVTARNHGRKA